LTISWLPSTDADTADNLLFYEIKINSGDWASTTLISGEDSARKYAKISATADTTYNIELKTKDELNNYSSGTAASYATPTVFIPENVSLALSLSYANNFNGPGNDCTGELNTWKAPVGFTINQTFNVSSIKVGLYFTKSSGSGPVNVSLRLYKNNIDSVYASTESISDANTGGLMGDRIYNFTTPVLLENGAQYYLDTSHWTLAGGAWATHDGSEFVTCNKSTSFTFNGSSTAP